MDGSLPISLKTAKAHLRVGDDCSSDGIIQQKLEMAIGIAEDVTNRPIRERVVVHRGVPTVIGYTKATIPPAIRAAILLILGTLYENEADNIVGRSVSQLSITAEKLLLPWRIHPYSEDVYNSD